MGSFLKKIQRSLHEVRVELKKVHWPAKQELLVYTSVVVAVILAVGVFFWVLDTGFTSVLKLVLK